MSKKEAYHKSTQEWSYYKFDTLQECIKLLHKKCKSEEFNPLDPCDFKFVNYEDNQFGIGIMTDYENH